MKGAEVGRLWRTVVRFPPLALQPLVEAGVEVEDPRLALVRCDFDFRACAPSTYSSASSGAHSFKVFLLFYYIRTFRKAFVFRNFVPAPRRLLHSTVDLVTRRRHHPIRFYHCLFR